MATQAITDGLIFPQSKLTGLGSNDDPNSAAAFSLLGGQVTPLEPFVAANVGDGLGFISRDATNDTVTVGTGLAYVLDDSSAADNDRGSGGNPTIRATQDGSTVELPDNMLYAVVVPTQTTVDVSDSQSNTIWLNITSVTTNNSVEIRSDGGGGTTATPSDSFLKLGTANPDDSTADTRANDFASPIFRALEVRGDITDDQGNTYVDYSAQALTPPRVDTPTIENDDYHETVTTGNVSGTTGLDLSSANFFRHTLTGNTTFNFNNPSGTPAGNSFTLIIEQDGTGGHTITWPSSVEWDSGSAPGLSTGANDKHMVGFVSPDGGTTWIGVVSATGIA